MKYILGYVLWWCLRQYDIALYTWPFLSIEKLNHVMVGAKLWHDLIIIADATLTQSMIHIINPGKIVTLRHKILTTITDSQTNFGGNISKVVVISVPDEVIARDVRLSIGMLMTGKNLSIMEIVTNKMYFNNFQNNIYDMCMRNMWS